jgi:hypothetical protein
MAAALPAIQVVGQSNTLQWLIIGGGAIAAYYLYTQVPKKVVDDAGKALDLAGKIQEIGWTVAEGELNAVTSAATTTWDVFNMALAGYRGDKADLTEREIDLVLQAGSGDNSFLSLVFDFANLFDSKFGRAKEAGSEFIEALRDDDPRAWWMLNMVDKWGRQGSPLYIGTLQMFPFHPFRLRDLIWDNATNKDLAIRKLAPTMGETIQPFNIAARVITHYIRNQWDSDVLVRIEIKESGSVAPDDEWLDKFDWVTKPTWRKFYAYPHRTFVRVDGQYKGKVVELGDEAQTEIGLIGWMRKDGLLQNYDLPFGLSNEWNILRRTVAARLNNMELPETFFADTERSVLDYLGLTFGGTTDGPAGWRSGGKFAPGSYPVREIKILNVPSIPFL